MKEYWTPIGITTPVELEFRAQLALKLISSNTALIAGDPDGDLHTPKELVKRCFAVAYEFVNLAESQGLLKEVDRDKILESEIDLDEIRSEIRRARRDEKLTKLASNLKEAK